jgi:Protein DA1
MDSGDCQPLYHSIRDYYEGMNMRIDQQIPMLLVERQALNDAMEGEKDVIKLFTCLFILCCCPTIIKSNKFCSFPP